MRESIYDIAYRPTYNKAERNAAKWLFHIQLLEIKINNYQYQQQAAKS